MINSEMESNSKSPWEGRDFPVRERWGVEEEDGEGRTEELVEFREVMDARLRGGG